MAGCEGSVMRVAVSRGCAGRWMLMAADGACCWMDSVGRLQGQTTITHVILSREGTAQGLTPALSLLPSDSSAAGKAT